MESRFLELSRRYDSLTPAEAKEFNEHLDDFAKRTFDSCPVCHGSFSQYESRAKPFHCPNCGVELFSTSGDILPHREHEVDPSTPDEHWLGVFAIWYYPASCKPCDCMVLGDGYYPARYACCPGLLELATKMLTSEVPNKRTAAATFLVDHKETLVNCMRGDYAKLFKREQLGQIAESIDDSRIASAVSELLRHQISKAGAQ